MTGWIKIFRQLADKELWLAEPFTRGQAWVDLILLANHKESEYRIRGVAITVKRGQVAWSEDGLAKRWKWSRGKVRRFLKEMEKKEQQIVQQKNNIITLLSIVNYDKFQRNEQETVQQTVQQTDSKQYNKRYTYNNDKNDKECKEEEIETNVEKFSKKNFFEEEGLPPEINPRFKSEPVDVEYQMAYIADKVTPELEQRYHESIKRRKHQWNQ